MGVIGYIPIDHPSGRIDIPIVGPGESILPSRVRARRGGSTGEPSIVYPEDVRASPLVIRQGGVVYAVAYDTRTEIGYAPNRSVSTSSTRSSPVHTASVLLGRTYFNRVTRLEASLTAKAQSYCTTWDSLSNFEQTTAAAWIRAVGPVTLDSSKVAVTAGGNHPVFSAWWTTGWKSSSGNVALDVPAGTYDVYLYVQCTWAGTGHPGSAGDAIATCSTWKEIARG